MAHLDEIAQRLPVRTRARVVSLARDAATGDYIVSIDGGEKLGRATSWWRRASIRRPRFRGSAAICLQASGNFTPTAIAIRSSLCRELIVVGSAQSGAQIAEELYKFGRKVYLAVGPAGRTPRRYRGKDANWWLARRGHYDYKVGELPSPRAKFAGKPHISGTKGGHTLNLHQFARDGVTLLGRLEGIEGGIVKLKGDLHDNLAEADRAEADFVKTVDSYIAATGMSAPAETLPVLRDGFDQTILIELDLAAAGITNVIWATGYAFDFSMIKLPVADGDDFPIQTRGVSAFPGLFFVGLPWLLTAMSGLIYGLAEDARYIAERRDADEDERAILLLPEQSGSQEPKRSPATRTLADGVTTLASAAIVSLALTASHAAEAPLPPCADFIPTPASQLYPGMMADDAIRVTGEAARETDVTIGATQIRKLKFIDAIPRQVILSDGKVSRVTLDAFRMDRDPLPSSIRQASPGLADSAVRRALGEPAAVFHHSFFGIDVDQWIYASAGDDASVFFRDGRVIAKADGRHLPADLFQVSLPSPPRAERKPNARTSRGHDDA